MSYFWIRLFNYSFERDGHEKGTLLDEFYLKDIEKGREEVKKEIQLRYEKELIKKLKFAKPRKKDGIYAIIMESNKFFYDRFYVTIDTVCFYCHTPIKGKASEFPRDNIESYIEKAKSNLNLADYGSEFDNETTVYFCSYDCKRDYIDKVKYCSEGEFQDREEGNSGKVYGYIYEIYNRSENKYYVGQTKYLPFFRWQEHVKDGSKGNLSDLSFRSITAVNKSGNNDEDQKYLNSIEAWWIQKYIDEGKKVFNLTIPKITVEDLKEKYNSILGKSNK